MTSTRREFLKSVSATLLCNSSILQAASLMRLQATGKILVSPGKQGNDKFCVGFLNLDTLQETVIETGFAIHSVLQDPIKKSIFFALPQRPGTQAAVLDFDAKKVVSIVDASPGHFFYGHGAVTSDGRFLYTTMSQRKKINGAIHVRELPNLKLIGSFSSHGYGPHDICFDGTGENLLVANGGFDNDAQENSNYTEPSSLALVEIKSEKLLWQSPKATEGASLRHLALNSSGVLAVGMQSPMQLGFAPVAIGNLKNQSLDFIKADQKQLELMGGIALSPAVSIDGKYAAFTHPSGNSYSAFQIEANKLVKISTEHGPQGISEFPTICGEKNKTQECSGGFVLTTAQGKILFIDDNGKLKKEASIASRLNYNHSKIFYFH